MSILVLRKGGLGNQLFQVAAGIVYAEETGKRVILPDTPEKNHVTVDGDYADLVFKGFERMRTCIGETYPDFETFPGHPGFEPWDPSMCSAHNVLLYGFFQYYPPIGRHEALLRSYFCAQLPNANMVHEGKVGVHVRRGDWVNFPVQNESYYVPAMQKYSSSSQFVVFSDDIEWCKQQPMFAACSFDDTANEIDALARMATCTGGFICGNSTFSWWGAFLGAHERRAPVCVPRNWIGSSPLTDLHPPEWQLL